MCQAIKHKKYNTWTLQVQDVTKTRSDLFVGHFRAELIILWPEQHPIYLFILFSNLFFSPGKTSILFIQWFYQVVLGKIKAQSTAQDAIKPLHLDHITQTIILHYLQ